MTGYWLQWIDAGQPVWHQVFHLGHGLCYWWSFAAGGFVTGACP